MAAAIGVRSYFTSADLPRFLRRCDDPDQVRRVLALALILNGGSRSGHHGGRDAANREGLGAAIDPSGPLRTGEA